PCTLPAEPLASPPPTTYRGVGTVVTTPPGPVSVLVPLPLFIRSPTPPPPGSAIVCMFPTRPVVTAGPRNVKIARPAFGAAVA
ncbi:MAG: hypothetical protein ACRD1G_03820, partial [Acidimicrobiales bacterium]